MDDIAKHIGISKKTLYQHFSNKEDLVYALMKKELDTTEEILDNIKKQSKNSIDEIMRIMDFFNQFFANFNPVVIYDTQKYYPKAWKLFDQHKQSGMLEGLIKNLKRGIKEGLYRKDIDIPIISRLRMEMVQTIFNLSVFSPRQFDMQKVHVQSLSMFMYGIASEKGLKLIKTYSTKPRLKNK